jgi:hypothetical protein
LERIWKGVVVTAPTLKGTEEYSENLSEESRCPSRNSNRPSHEHKSEELVFDQPARWDTGNEYRILLMSPSVKLRRGEKLKLTFGIANCFPCVELNGQITAFHTHIYTNYDFQG